MNEKQPTKKKEKEYTAFGVTGGFGTMIWLFIVLLLCKCGYILLTFFPELLQNIKGMFGG